MAHRPIRMLNIPADILQELLLEANKVPKHLVEDSHHLPLPIVEIVRIGLERKFWDIEEPNKGSSTALSNLGLPEIRTVMPNVVKNYK